MSGIMRSNSTTRGVQAGLTLVEFMVSIVIGMMMIAGLATLIASQSATRAEIDRSGLMIENGRYAVQTIASDVQLAGYWGELSETPAPPAALPDPCSTTSTDVEAAMGIHIQGYDASVALPADVGACLSNHKAGTDVLVVRKVDPNSTDLETAGVTDLTKLTDGKLYFQTGLSAGAFTIRVATSSSGTNSATFNLTKKSGAPGTIRKVITHIYYVSSCSVVASGACQDTIPTLKRVEKGQGATAPVTLAEGIENLQVDYGVDSDADGAPDGADVSGTALTNVTWPNVMTAHIYVLARAADKSPGFTDNKKYAMGTHGEVTPASADAAYKRHLFVQSVRIINPSARRPA
jgi:type IV pilus assembly protein PilW